MQGSIARGVGPDVKGRFPELGNSRTDIQCALQFARTTPGVITSLSGVSKLSHLEENAAIIRCPALYRS